MEYEYRIEIDSKILRNIFQDLRSKGYTLRSICKTVKGFSDALYRGYTLPEKSFQQLERIFGNPIKHKIRTKNKNIDPSTIMRDSKLAELVGIILGDGTVGHYIDKNHKNIYLLEITLNGIGEMEYVLYVKKLMTQIFKKPYYRQRTDSKAAILRIQDKNLYHFLLSIGLKSGNKIVNQVNVPDWIKNKKNLIISCLRGLFDTDGNISLDKRYDSLKLIFRNHSEPLLLDFRKMTEAIGVKPSKRGNNRVQIQSKREVKKFLEIVEPIKWKVKLKRDPSIIKKLDYKINIK